MIRIIVNNIPFFVKKNISILEAVSFIGLKLPRFCYHEALSIAGNCRICLVEIEAALKLVASCAQPVSPDMQIYTNSIKVLKARENVLESLLLNHPLDCPICDQAGECDLQDQSKVFGGISSRNFFSKRSVENKIIDPCIKTIMTRCIHCTRCVRFVSEIGSKPFLGTLNRGRSTEIGSYISHFIDSSEISGNVIDLCPVGALTAKPYAFKARPWELRTIETIDLTDGLGSNIYANLKELELISILPKNNEAINGQWISNKARFSYDAQQRYRLSTVYKKSLDTKKMESSTFLDVVSKIKNIDAVNVYVNDELDFETALYLKQLELANPNKISLFNISTRKVAHSNFYNYVKQPVLDLVNTEGKVVVLLASNIRTECAVINAKLRIKAKNKKLSIFQFGAVADSSFNLDFLNLNVLDIINFLEGKHFIFNKVLTSYQPIFIIGESLFTRLAISSQSLLQFLKNYYPTALVYNLSQKANTEGFSFLNFKPRANNVKKSNNIYLNLDDTLETRSLILLSNFKKHIWLHSHGSQVAKNVDYLLPVKSYFECEAFFINLEGRPQQTAKVIENNGSFSYTTLELCKELFGIFNTNNFAFVFLQEIIKNPNLFNLLSVNLSSQLNTQKTLYSTFNNYPFKSFISDYYLTNSYTKYSLNMINYSNVRRSNFTNF